MSLPYIEENFISSDECQRLIDFADANKKKILVKMMYILQK